MNIYGVDFTSRPTARKPIMCAECRLDSGSLIFEGLRRLVSFEQFDTFLATEGPWLAGMDFPFGQSRRFIQNAGWPDTWESSVRFVDTLSRSEFRQRLDDYRTPRAAGDKEHRRQGDAATGAISPQKLYGVPVGLMFYEGARRLLHSGVTIQGLIDGDPGRQVVEAYPGVLARRATRSGYKNDAKAKQSDVHRSARRRITDYIQSNQCADVYGLTVTLEGDLDDDPTGDSLDAVLCALQAGWAWRHRDEIETRLNADHRLEGWIADPLALGM